MKIEKASVTNGKGIRTVLWVSGCSLHCKGCQNPETWDFSAGKLFDRAAKQKLFEYLALPYIQGLTISGGHPLERENVYAIYMLLLEVKKRFPNKDVWLYTGLELTYDDFNICPLDWTNPRATIRSHILNLCDVVVDGRYNEKLRDTTLPFRGSGNQRLIDVKQSIQNRKITLFRI